MRVVCFLGGCIIKGSEGLSQESAASQAWGPEFGSLEAVEKQALWQVPVILVCGESGVRRIWGVVSQPGFANPWTAASVIVRASKNKDSKQTMMLLMLVHLHAHRHIYTNKYISHSTKAARQYHTHAHTQIHTTNIDTPHTHTIHTYTHTHIPKIVVENLPGPWILKTITEENRLRCFSSTKPRTFVREIQKLQLIKAQD